MFRKKIQKLGQITLDPPHELPIYQKIAHVVEIRDHDLYLCKTADGETLLAELPARFRCKIWVRRGGFVVIDTHEFDKKGGKIQAEITIIIQNEKIWKKKKYWLNN
ncbi:hypothetical protein PNEG_02475 [Pneumocystis murina B123]|uniref:S1-like domain-containing protein n=1 Tax=Pneumocystis murina (strain B123) TaxID=1069680 RepID=M7NPE6_PNEMU|nr:hypothetical protein PNEG_02475 [Pneumocystis murina B123]EMR09132.1 hypothetical protein PNEG_02475 [Pneumocystis murina B123]